MTRGVLAEFDTQHALLEGLQRLRQAGYRQLDAYTPWPVKGVDELLELPRSPVAAIVLAGGLFGALFAYWVQWYTNASDYPLIVGARPAHAWPAFVLIVFETAVLCAGLASLAGVLAKSRLPRLWDPLFEVPEFQRASLDRFFISVDAKDPNFDVRRLTEELRHWGAVRVMTVDREGQA